MSTARLIHILSLCTLSALPFTPGCATTSTNQDVLRTLAPAHASSFAPIVAQAQKIGCKVSLQDQQLPLLIIDCPQGRVAFGPDSGKPRVSGVESLSSNQGLAESYLQADCLHGMQSHCQEYVEQLLGQPATPPELRAPKGPNPLVRPAGHGWFCFNYDFGGVTLPSCYRSDAECGRRQQAQAARGNKTQPCAAVERASCYTTGRGQGDWECAATPAGCEQARNKGASACGLWE